MQTRLFWDTKMRLFYPPHISGPWHQNKWSVLSGHAAETGDADRSVQSLATSSFFSSTVHPPAHRPVRRSRYSQREVPSCTAANLRPPNSPDLNNVDYKVWGIMQDHVYWAKVQDVVDLKQRLIDVWDSLEQSVIDDTIDQWRSRLHTCVHAKEGLFEQSL